MSALPPIRGVALVAALVVNVLLAAAAPAGRPALAWLHPLAPPLTHIPEMGEAVLGASDAGAAAPAVPQGPPQGPPRHDGPPQGPPRGPPPLRGLAGTLERTVRTVGTPAQQAPLADVRALDAELYTRARRSQALRLAVQADAVAIADVLGPDRVGVIVAQKDTLSTELGEGRAWAAAITRVAP